MVITARCTAEELASPSLSLPGPASDLLSVMPMGASSSGRTYPRSTRSWPSLSMLAKTRAMIGRDREGYELLERHAVLGIDGEQLLEDRGEPQSLLHHGDRGEEGRGNILLRLPLLAQGLEGLELVERMERSTLSRQADRPRRECRSRRRAPRRVQVPSWRGASASRAGRAPGSGGRRRKFRDMPVSPPSASRTNIEPLQQAAPRNVAGKFLD